MNFSSRIRAPLAISPKAVKSAPHHTLAVWWGVFCVMFSLSVSGMLIGILTHQLTQGGQVLSFAVVSIVALSLISGQIDRVNARHVRDQANQAWQESRRRAAELDANTPLRLTARQLAWCQKSPVVCARLMVLKDQRPGGVLLKRDMRELIDLRLRALATARTGRHLERVVA